MRGKGDVKIYWIRLGNDEESEIEKQGCIGSTRELRGMYGLFLM